MRCSGLQKHRAVRTGESGARGGTLVITVRNTPRKIFKNPHSRWRAIRRSTTTRCCYQTSSPCPRRTYSPSVAETGCNTHRRGLRVSGPGVGPVDAAHHPPLRQTASIWCSKSRRQAVVETSACPSSGNRPIPTAAMRACSKATQAGLSAPDRPAATPHRERHRARSAAADGFLPIAAMSISASSGVTPATVPRPRRPISDLQHPGRPELRPLVRSPPCPRSRRRCGPVPGCHPHPHRRKLQPRSSTNTISRMEIGLATQQGLRFVRVSADHPQTIAARTLDVEFVHSRG